MIQRANKLSFDQIASDPTFTFNIKDRDIIVFLHIQKTGEHLQHEIIDKILIA